MPDILPVHKLITDLELQSTELLYHHDDREWIKEIIKDVHESQVFDIGSVDDVTFPECQDLGGKIYKLPFEKTLLFVRTIYGNKFILIQQFDDDSICIELMEFENKRNCYNSSGIRTAIDSEGVGSFITFKTFKDKYSNDFAMDRCWKCIALIHIFTSTLNCSNVYTEQIKPAKNLQKKRIKAGKLPFYSHHILKIKQSKSTGVNKGGTHASPRVHMRRGHIRRLSLDRTTWVSPCMVTGSNGFISKTYQV